jgi:hypothetical protein
MFSLVSEPIGNANLVFPYPTSTATVAAFMVQTLCWGGAASAGAVE